MDADVVADLLQPVTQESLLAEEASRPKASRAKGQPPQAVAAARGRLRRRRSSPIRSGIAFVAAPCIRPRGARNATHTLLQQPAGECSGMSTRFRLGFLGAWALFIIGAGLACLGAAAQVENWQEAARLARLERIDRAITLRMGEIGRASCRER